MDKEFKGNANNNISLIYKILILIWFTFCLYFLVAFQFDLHEGIWEILFRISAPIMMFGLLPMMYVAIRHQPDEFFSNFKGVIGCIFLIGFICFFAKDLVSDLWHPFFDKSKTITSQNYKVHMKIYRGTKQYFLYFDDDNEPDSCDSQQQKCKYTYKTRINSETYKKLDLANQGASTKNTPIELLFKPKAEILMNWKMK